MIELRLIGCNGGIGGAARQTTCYGIGDSVVIDAGTGLGTLSLEALARIDHVVLTHAHLDHVAALPLMIDSVASLRNKPLTVWALPEVIAILRAHLFNDKIWPDFSQIPTPSQAFMRYSPIGDAPFEIAGYRFSVLPAMHGIPACGYRVERGGKSLAFSGDTADCADFWTALMKDEKLTAVVVECSYPSHMTEMANLSSHMHAGIVAERLRVLPDGVTAIVIHRKPGLEDDIATELMAALPGLDLRLPEPGDTYLL